MTNTTVGTPDDLKLVRTATPSLLGYSAKQIAAACLLSGLIAGTVTALTGADGVKNGVPVNRRPILTPYRRPMLTPLSDGFWR